jgi:predicted anti-sigma-YlaC factor YlaD
VNPERADGRGAGLDCKDVVEILSDYLDDVMTPEDKRRVDEHLAACEGCDRALEQLRETVRATGMLTEEQLTDEQRATLLTAFRTWQADSAS